MEPDRGRRRFPATFRGFREEPAGTGRGPLPLRRAASPFDGRSRAGAGGRSMGPPDARQRAIARGDDRFRERARQPLGSRRLPPPLRSGDSDGGARRRKRKSLVRTRGVALLPCKRVVPDGTSLPRSGSPRKARARRTRLGDGSAPGSRPGDPGVRAGALLARHRSRHHADTGEADGPARPLHGPVRRVERTAAEPFLCGVPATPRGGRRPRLRPGAGPLRGVASDGTPRLSPDGHALDSRRDGEGRPGAGRFPPGRASAAEGRPAARLRP